MPKGICSVDGCDHWDARLALGMCRAHHSRFKKSGDAMAGVAVRRKGAPPLPCREPNCTEPVVSKDRCVRHYNEHRTSALCAVTDCARRVSAAGLCKSHYLRKKKYGDPLAGPPITLLTGRTVRREGYVLLRLPDHPNADKSGYVREHTVVMAESLGRPLAPGENVHHINGDRADNRRENLELWVTMQPSGQRPPDLVRHALAILERYGADPDDSRHTGGRL